MVYIEIEQCVFLDCIIQIKFVVVDCIGFYFNVEEFVFDCIEYVIMIMLFGQYGIQRCFQLCLGGKLVDRKIFYVVWYLDIIDGCRFKFSFDFCGNFVGVLFMFDLEFVDISVWMC